jgi:hypothetical protein
MFIFVKRSLKDKALRSVGGCLLCALCGFFLAYLRLKGTFLFVLCGKMAVDLTLTFSCE